MRITERKYLDVYKKSIGNEVPSLGKEFDFQSERLCLKFLKRMKVVSSITLNIYVYTICKANLVLIHSVDPFFILRLSPLKNILIV